jgi:hypothetical protein
MSNTATMYKIGWGVSACFLLVCCIKFYKKAACLRAIC